MNENRRIGRRIYQTTCHCITYDDNNERQEFDTVVNGTCANLDRASTRVKHELKLRNVLVTEFHTESKYYSMNIEDFIKHATSVTE